MASDKSVLTTNKILASIKRRILAPSSNNTFRDSDLIEFLNEEMNIGLVPTILQMKDEYLVYRVLVPITSKTAYPIPSRSIGNKLREVSLSTDGIEEQNMTRISLDTKDSIRGITKANQFYIQGNNVHLAPNHGLNGYLVFYYYIRPNAMVLENAVGTITNIDRTTGTITLNAIPSTYNTAQTFDFVNYNSPNNIISIDVPVTSINSVTRTVIVSPSNIPDELKVGDFMPLSGETSVPNIPTELHSILAQRVGIRIIEALGGETSKEKDKLSEMEAKLGLLLDNRVDGSPIIQVNKSSQSLLGNRFRRGLF